jgi:hypothetical protein
MPLRMAVVLAALVAALAVSGCGDSDDDGGEAPAADRAQTSDAGNANASDDGAAGAAAGGGSACGGYAAAADGGGTNASSGDTEPVNLTQERLTPAELQSLQEKAPTAPPYTRYDFDRGSEQDRKALMALFRKMQKQFYGGRFMAFCKEFGTNLYALPDLQSGDSQKRFKECAAIVSRIAKRVAAGELDWPPHRVLWVRIYRDPGTRPFGGVTVTTRGSEVRVSFVVQGGRWRPEFRVPGDMKAINAR